MCGKFLLCDTTDSLVCGRHRDILQLVKGTENAHLREFRYAGDEQEFQVRVALFQR